MLTSAELEMRPLETHELEIVSGGGISPQQPASRDYHFGCGPYGPVQWDVYRYAIIPNAGGPGVD